MAGKRRVPLLIAFAGATAALVGALAIAAQAWDLFARIADGEIRILAATIWNGITEGGAGSLVPTVEAELLLLGALSALALLARYSARGGAVALMLAGLCGFALLVGATLELASLPASDCAPGGEPSGEPVCINLYSAAFEGGRGLDGWQLWLVAFGGLAAAAGSALQLYLANVLSGATASQRARPI